MAKYLLEAPDAEMEAWKAAAAKAGVPFAEWLREAARSLARGDVSEPPVVRAATVARALRVGRNVEAVRRDLADGFKSDFKPDKPEKKKR